MRRATADQGLFDWATKKYRVSCRQFTIEVETNERGVVVAAAPLARGFVGQPLTNLTKWAARSGGLEVDEL